MKPLFCNLLWIERFILNLIFKCTVEILFDQNIILFALNRWFHFSAQKDNKIIITQLEFYWRLLTSKVLIYWLLIFAMQSRIVLNKNIYFNDLFLPIPDNGGMVITVLLIYVVGAFFNICLERLQWIQYANKIFYYVKRKF